MNIIKQNPFRVLGLTGNASERELQKQIAVIKRYAEIGKTKSFEYDIPMLGALNRDLAEIQQASNKIEQGQKRLLYSLFWFVNHNKFDEIALSNLNNKKIDKAIEIWDKTLKEEITSKNFSSYHNLSTLYIASATASDQLGIFNLKQGISLKCTLMHSEYFGNLSELVLREKNNYFSYEFNQKFIDEIIGILDPYFNKMGGITKKEFILIFDNSPANIQKYVTAKFSEEDLSTIENQIDKTSVERKTKPSSADKLGTTLYKSTRSKIISLKTILGHENVQYKMIVNKLADEVLQCSIDYYNKLREEDGDVDPGESALKVAKYAKAIGGTGQGKERIDETISVIQEWVDDAPVRKKQEKISQDIASISFKLEKFQGQLDSTTNAEKMVISCHSELQNIKMVLGSQDDFYLQVSSAIANNALGMLITVVNEAQNGTQFHAEKLASLQQIISSALSVMSSIGRLDMDYDTKERFKTNSSSIEGINTQLRSLSRKSNSSSDGCYIATMAYGDYNHPQVMILRKFRDDKLSNWTFGKSFIRLYYATSPYLVKLLKNKKNINRSIRNILDKFITKAQ